MITVPIRFKSFTFMLLCWVCETSCFISYAPILQSSIQTSQFGFNSWENSRRLSIKKELWGKHEEDDDIDREMAKARALLIEAKKQIAAMDAGLVYTEPENAEGSTSSLPFFASETSSPQSLSQRNSSMSNKRDIVIKSRTEDGLVTVNGEKLAQMSEHETWRARPLGEVFENELTDDEDVYALATESLRQRDVAASIFNLRKSMQPQDYKKIFDRKNYFIGEDV
jgi:hypothetical protein